MTSDDGESISWFSETSFLKIWRYTKTYVEHIQFVGFSEIAFAEIPFAEIPICWKYTYPPEN